MLCGGQGSIRTRGGQERGVNSGQKADPGVLQLLLATNAVGRWGQVGNGRECLGWRTE